MTNWELFFGRFHPLFVHLPIGIFILGYLFELLYSFGYRKLIPSRKIVLTTYGLGLIAGVAAVITGLLLASGNQYNKVELDKHKFLGLATLVVMLAVIFYHVWKPAHNDKLKLIGSTIAIVLTGLTGHFGGNLTHGSEYLAQYGPELFKNKKESVYEKVSKMDQKEVHIYADIVHPVMQEKCKGCHNKENHLGGLNLDSFSNFFKEANHEIPIVSGDIEKSEIYRRISLPLNHSKRMPPRGMGFGYTDSQILKYWIESGADSLATFNSDTMSEELIALINRDYGLDYSPRAYYEKIVIDSLDKGVLTQIREADFRVNYLSEKNHLLDVEFKGDSIQLTQIEKLNKISHAITFLKVANCNLSDNLIESITDIPHLTRIDVSNNPLSDELISFLVKHPNLNVVNLNNTQLSNLSLIRLLEETDLQRIYAMNTNVTKKVADSLEQSHAKTEITVNQFKFEEIVAAKSVFEQKEIKKPVTN